MFFSRFFGTVSVPLGPRRVGMESCEVTGICPSETEERTMGDCNGTSGKCQSGKSGITQ